MSDPIFFENNQNLKESKFYLIMKRLLCLFIVTILSSVGIYTRTLGKIPDSSISSLNASSTVNYKTF
jgi:hypothetical protein